MTLCLSSISTDETGGAWAVTQDMTVSVLCKKIVGVKIKTTTLQVLYREGTGHGNVGQGSSWSPGLGKMRSIAVGPQVTRAQGETGVTCHDIRRCGGSTGPTRCLCGLA